MTSRRKLLLSTFLVGMLFAAGRAAAADPACAELGPMKRPIEYQSVTVQPDRRITFRLCAPRATDVRVISSEIDSVPTGYDGKPAGLAMSKDAQAYWSVTTDLPVAPGPHRYAFAVSGVVVPDPQATHFSETFRGVVSVLDVDAPEAAFESFHADVAHGLVSTIDYVSPTTGEVRRAHVYTPPGYEGAGKPQRYPVLYLVHGAGDSDDSWTSVGHANAILDNLIAAGKAKPMIVVMPFGHTPARDGVARMNNTDFGKDLIGTLVPYIDAHFRTIARPAERAMAGLSMGGAHTLQFGVTHPEVFGPIGVFSIGLAASQPPEAYAAEHHAELARRAQAKTLLYYAIGSADPFHASAAPTRKVFDDAKIGYEFHESSGGHTWSNWRDYLAAFAPKLFR